MTPVEQARIEAYSLPVRVTTWNVGRGTLADLADLMAVSDVIALQETGDRFDAVIFAARADWTVVNGDGEPGQPSTILLVRPGIEVLREVAVPVLSRRYIGPGAGPDHNKPKWAIGALLRTGGVTFGVVSTHLVASQYRRLRRKAARHHIASLRRRFSNRYFPWIIAGDFNTTPRRGVLRPLYQRGWTNTHRAGRTRRTHKLRAIDYLWWRSGRVRFLVAHTIETKSDHRALTALFLIGVTRHR